MNKELSTITFLISEPFEKALKLVRKALGQADLEISAELDLSGKLRRDLGIGLPACTILFVDCPFLMLEATALDRSAAVFVPMHVVLAARGNQTIVHYMNAASLQNDAMPVGARMPISKLQSRISEALSKIAARQEAFQLVH